MKRFQLEHYLLFGLCGFLLAVAVTTDYHRVVDYLYSDEAVYYMMAQSLAFDQDMEYTLKDLRRVYVEGWYAGPQGVYLTKATDGKIYYGKYLAYSFFLAPFLVVFGLKGFLILNVLLLCGMIWMGWAYLRQFNPQNIALLVALTFFLLSASFIYTFWLTPETFNMFCITTGLFLWLYRREEPWSAKIHCCLLYLAPIPIAIACASKITNILFLVPILADVLLEYRNRQKPNDLKKPFVLRFLPCAAKILILGVVFGIFLGVFFGLQYKMTGHFNQYAGDRRMFIWNFPFNAPYDVWNQGIRHSNEDYGEKSFFLTPKTLLYNIYYYLFGRFTGMLPYFVCSFLALYYFGRQVITGITSPFRRIELWRRFILLFSIGANIAAYLVMAPINYHGGSGAFGNRFFLNIYPAFLFLITAVFQRGGERRVPVPLVISWIVGSLFLAQALLNPFQTSYYPAAPAFKFPYRFLPVELTMINALPTHVNPHLMQAADHEDPPYRVYFVDENITEMSAREFWVKGKQTSEFVVLTSPSQTHLVVMITNGPIANQVDVSVAGVTQSLRLDVPGEQRRLVFPLNWSMPYFRSVLYPVKIHSRTGFVPKFVHETGLTDPRYLGCRVNIALNPFEVGRAYLENGQPQKALTVLEPIAKTHPNDLQIRYYLGIAYQQAGNIEAAIAELEHCQTLLPNFQISKTYEAEDISRKTGAVVEQPTASNGKAVLFNPNKDPAGFVTFGQYAEFPAGQYQAKYRMSVVKRNDTHAVQSEIGLFFDVYSQKYGVLKKDQIVVAEEETEQPEEYRDYTLNFEIASPTTLEFRVEVTGHAQVLVDKIDVYPRLPLEIYRAFAQVKSKIGAYADAHRYLQQAIEIDPWTPELQIEFLQTLINLKRWDQAVQFAKSSGHFSRTHTGIVTYLNPQRLTGSSDLPESVAQFYNAVSARFTPKNPLSYTFDDQFAFIGYDLAGEKIIPGGHFSIQYYWKSLKPTDEDYAIFVHFSKQGKLLVSETVSKIKRKIGLRVTDLFQQDHQPVHGAYPTSKWLANELIREQYDVVVPPEIEPGTYEIRIGVWNPFTKTRLKTDGKTEVKIGEIKIN